MAEPRKSFGLMALSREQSIHAVPKREYLGFRLADKTYAIDIEKVGEILRIPPITPVPRTTDTIMGVVSVRGKVLSLIDLRSRLGLDSPLPSRLSRILVLPWSKDDSVGLYVDDVLDVVRLGKDDIEITGKGTSSELGDHVMGIAKVDGILFVILHLESFLGL